ncbi:transglutaminase-like domain-containing protein [Agriterribacter sp.]|uniref:transglutaminase domain-containing protein n=1 Tax=Agriterribacter sp. TaxID=2821509 RepID=UPI002B99FD15|nr:transglutaminase-like domain-containing protein [Agriterribacter sp.]HRO48449.1 transglutaminase-like domain-containing protein [Agriterribacter sp.]HRQ18740.1 transglutaminase-like domain-containing protein [Agriterribacter sp.]
MKFHLLVYGMLLGCGVANGQLWNNYAGFGRFAIAVPDSTSRSPAALAAYIQNRYDAPKVQLQAIYGWVTDNIRYDDDSSYYFNRSVDHETKIAATLRRRKGVCENYAGLFADLASRIGLTSYVVYGYPAGVSTRGNTGHAWCAVYLDDAWWLFDPTWDAGQQGSFRYFMVHPATFIQTHIPFDPLWQLLEKPVSYGNTTTKNKTVFHYKDSVQAFLQMDSLQQYLAIEHRMKNAGANNEMFKLWQGYNRMNIAIIAGEQDMQLYNAAVDNLNTATDIFNSFVQYRNNGFLPQKQDAVIKTMLEPVSMLIAEANQKLDGIGLLVENFQYDTEGIRKQLLLLSKRSGEQKEFLKKYLAAGPTERAQLFYGETIK